MLTYKQLIESLDMKVKRISYSGKRYNLDDRKDLFLSIDSAGPKPNVSTTDLHKIVDNTKDADEIRNAIDHPKADLNLFLKGLKTSMAGAVAWQYMHDHENDKKKLPDRIVKSLIDHHDLQIKQEAYIIAYKRNLITKDFLEKVLNSKKEKRDTNTVILALINDIEPYKPMSYIKKEIALKNKNK